MFRIERGKEDTLKNLALQFYKKLNPKKKSGAYKKNSLKKRMLKQYHKETDHLKKRFYKELVAKNYQLLKKVVVGDTIELANVISHFDNLIAAGSIPPFYTLNGHQYSSTKFGEEVLKVFNYTYCRGSIKFIWLVDTLDIVICPYCNYEYTFKTKTTKDDIILHDFDHFIPKVVTPYLSLSFYNLIPSCHSCNSTLKGYTIFSYTDYIHPYVDNLAQFFSFTIDRPVMNNDINSFSVAKKDNTVDGNELRKLNNHCNVFQLFNRYFNFKDDVLRLHELKSTYTETYKQQLLTTGIGAITFANRNELLKFIGRTIDVPINDRIASRMTRGKFKRDIATEFEIIT